MKVVDDAAVVDGDDEDDELGVLKLADDAIVAQAVARQAKWIWMKRPERIKRCHPRKEEERFLTSASRPSRKSEAEEKASARFVRNDLALMEVRWTTAPLLARKPSPIIRAKKNQKTPPD